MANRVTIPLVNPNEPESRIAGLHVDEGQKVRQDDLLCTLETTKSTAEVSAESDGYIIGLHYTVGATVTAGETLCYLADQADWTPPKDDPIPEGLMAQKSAGKRAKQQKIPDGLRITQPALELAQRKGLLLTSLPIGPLVTEAMMLDLLERSDSPAQLARPESAFDATALIVYGGGGHGKSVIDLILTLRTFHLVGIIDDGLPPGEEILGIPVLGGADQLDGLRDRGVQLAANAVGGIGNIQSRVNVFKRLSDAGFGFPNFTHPTAFVESSASLSPGVQTFPHAYIGSEVQVGFGVIVNTGAIISHDCQLDDFANVAPGAILAGAVQVSEGTLIGMGVTVNLGVRIGPRARIGNGATIKDDVPEGGVVRAGSVWPD